MATVFWQLGAIANSTIWTPEYLVFPEFGYFALVFLFASMFAIIGLVLVLIVCRPIIPHWISGLPAMALFLFVAGLVGFVVFGLLFGFGAQSILYASITALSFVVFCREWFRKWEEPTLA
ncbi:MAG: hypothetical protein AAGK17_12075 [Pseudomonadota bacterium]